MTESERLAWGAAAVMNAARVNPVSVAICAINGWKVPWFARPPGKADVDTAREVLRQWRLHDKS